MRKCSTFLFLIAVVGCCLAQDEGEFSQQDGFSFPGEASRPDRFPQQPPNRPNQPPFQPQPPNRPTRPPFQPQPPNRPTRPPFQPQPPNRPTQPPFQPQRPTQRPGDQRFTSPTPAPLPPSTTSSVADYNACVDRCQTTSEYNPVCGSDGTVYSNPGKLNCAVNCGNPIRFINYGQCQQ